MSMSPSPSISPTTILSGINPSFGALILASIALVVLLLCVIAAFIFGRKLQALHFDRDALVKAIAKDEEIKRIQELDKKKLEGPIDCIKNPLPVASVGGYNASYFWRNEALVLNTADVEPNNEEEVETWKKLHILKIWGQKEVQIWRKTFGDIEIKYETDDVEKRRKLDELDYKANTGALSPDNPFPSGLGDYNTNYFWMHQHDVVNLPDVPPNNIEDILDWQKLHALKEWGQREHQIYDEKRVEISKDAMETAESTIPKSKPLARTGGFTFILEFSTIMVIIFTLVVLGILGILPGNEISAILAAIAGYVLGRAATSAQGRSKLEEIDEGKAE